LLLPALQAWQALLNTYERVPLFPTAVSRAVEDAALALPDLASGQQAWSIEDLLEEETGMSPDSGRQSCMSETEYVCTICFMGQHHTCFLYLYLIGPEEENSVDDTSCKLDQLADVIRAQAPLSLFVESQTVDNATHNSRQILELEELHKVAL